MSAKPYPDHCLIPGEVDNDREADLYRRIRDTLLRAHCDDGRDEHRCVGRITLDRDGITLNCARCGDARQLLPGAHTRK